MPVGTTHGDGGHLDRTETHMSTCTFRDGPHAEQGEAGKEERALLQLHANTLADKHRSRQPEGQ